MPEQRLTTTQREELSDARLMLDSASHNLQTVLRGAAERPDLAQALANTRTQVEQVLAIIDRLEGRSRVREA
jgi:hypothetical protein